MLPAPKTHLSLPHPSTVITSQKEADSPTGDSVLSGHLRAMELNASRYEQPFQLPSIEQLFTSMDPGRRYSQSSVSTNRSSASGSASPTLPSLDRKTSRRHHQSPTRRLNQIMGQLYPYPNVLNRATRHSQSVPGRPRASESPDRPDANMMKAQREKGARKVLGGAMSKVQNACLLINPKLPEVARGKGWKPLKSNNINLEIPNALRYNKTDVLDTATCIQLQHYYLVLHMLQHIHQSGDAAAVEYYSALIEAVGTGEFPELPSEWTESL